MSSKLVQLPRWNPAGARFWSFDPAASSIPNPRSTGERRARNGKFGADRRRAIGIAVIGDPVDSNQAFGVPGLSSSRNPDLRMTNDSDDIGVSPLPQATFIEGAIRRPGPDSASHRSKGSSSRSFARSPGTRPRERVSTIPDV